MTSGHFYAWGLYKSEASCDPLPSLPAATTVTFVSCDLKVSDILPKECSRIFPNKYVKKMLNIFEIWKKFMSKFEL